MKLSKLDIRRELSDESTFFAVLIIIAVIISGIVLMYLLIRQTRCAL